MSIATDLVQWKPCWRIIPSRFPPIELFERVALPEDLQAIYDLEALTNDRLRHEAGNLQLICPEDRISGPGTSVIMAAFTHVNPLGSRFTDGSYGVFYASNNLTTSVEETRHHRACFMRATAQPQMELDMRVYNVDLHGELHDIRPLNDNHPGLYHPENYAASQQLGKQLREARSWGIIYSSVRHPTGECVAVFRPKILSNCRQERHLCYVWDGHRISMVYQKQLFGA